MGIKICPQCGGKVSETRNDCPHCNYDFGSSKKCPDCEELIDISLMECPICGHVFAKEADNKDLQTHTITQNKSFDIDSQALELEQNDNDLTCPYCSSSKQVLFGNNAYLCMVCKNKFIDTRGLPNPTIVTKKGEISTPQECAAYNAPDNTAAHQKDKQVSSSKYAKWLWIFAGWTAFFYIVNLIIAMRVGGYPGFMFEYIFSGYIAGFICMAIGVIAFLVSLILYLIKGSCQSKHIALSSLLLATTLIITFIPIVINAQYDFEHEIYYPTYPDGTKITELYITAMNDSSDEYLVIPSKMHGKKIDCVVFQSANQAWDSSKLTTIVFSDGIEMISNIPSDLSRINTIVIPSSATTIENEFINELKNYYYTFGKRINICYKGSYQELQLSGLMESNNLDFYSIHLFDNCNHCAE